MVVAAQHAKTQCQRARESMKERLLLDRIALQRPDVALRNVECACLVEANFADARQAVENDAPMAAREAPHAVVGQLLVKNALDSTLRKNVFEGAGFSGPGCQSLSESPLQRRKKATRLSRHSAPVVDAGGSPRFNPRRSRCPC